MYLNRRYLFILFSTILGVWLVTGCSSIDYPPAGKDQPVSATPVKEEPVEKGFIITPVTPSLETQEWGEEQSRFDSQGAVEVAVTPVNLDKAGETIEFEISLNTHSVDLSMDLADLSYLRTDTGQAVKAVFWDAPLGGHHVAGKLSFPAKVEGSSLIDGAREVRLIISDLDVPERVFVWQKP
jgi:hypothetical protein